MPEPTAPALPTTLHTVMVTGAAGHLGRSVAQVFAAQGHRLVLLDRDPAALQQAFSHLPAGQHLLLATDLLDAAAVQRSVDAAVQRFAGIHVLCNLAGGFRMGQPLHQVEDDDWSFLFDINARTLLHTVRAVVPVMLRAGGGRIVNVGATAALQGAALKGPYTAAKAVVLRLTETLSAELRDQGINVNCVLPSVLDTPENRAAMPSADPARWVAPHDLAQVIAFLASDAARAVHGAALPVTGLG